MSNIILNGNAYVKFPVDEKLYNPNTVFVGIDVNLTDWNQQGSSQIVGNYNGQGYGIFYHKGFENVLDFTIIDKGNDHTFFFNEDGGLISQRNFPDLSLASNFTVLLVDHTDSKYYFDQANNTCFKFDFNNLYVLDFTIPVGVISAMAVDKVGNVYFLDTANELIYKYSSLGVFIGNLAPIVNSHNNLVVLDNGTVISAFSRTGTNMVTDYDNNYYNLWGANVYRNGVPWFFINPKANNIGIDYDDNIWVVYDNNRVIKINKDGKILFDRLFHDIKPCVDASCPPKPSKADEVGIGFTHRDGEVVARIILNRSSYVINLDDSGEVIGCETIGSLLDVAAYPSTSYANTNLLTNGDFTGFYTSKRFGVDGESNIDSKVVVKVALVDPCDSEVEIFNLSTNVTDLKAGVHNLSFTFVGSTGTGSLYVDGVLEDSFVKQGLIYYIQDRLPPYLVGADSGNFRSKQEELGIKNPKFLVGEIENLTISTDINERQFNSNSITNINMEFPTKNPLAFRETVERLFLFRPTGMKSTQYDLQLVNTGIFDSSVQSKIEVDVRGLVETQAPTQTNMQVIDWKQEIRFKDLVQIQ